MLVANETVVDTLAMCNCSCIVAIHVVHIVDKQREMASRWLLIIAEVSQSYACTMMIQPCMIPVLRTLTNTCDLCFSFDSNMEITVSPSAICKIAA